jgi:hypothetical protein
VDHQRLGEILQQLRSRLRIDPEVRQFRMPIPARDDPYRDQVVERAIVDVAGSNHR